MFFLEASQRYLQFAAAAKSLQSCPTLCDPIDSSPPGSSIHGIFQARVPERVAIAFSEYDARSILNIKYFVDYSLNLRLLISLTRYKFFNGGNFQYN